MATRNSGVRAFVFTSLISAIIGIGGCGFHLRGTVQVPPELKTIQLQSPNPNSSLTKLLISYLKDAHVKITESAPVRLILSGEKEEKKTASYTSRAKTAEYELVQSVTFEVTNQRGGNLASPQTLSVRRTYNYNDRKIVGMSEEEDMLRKEMNSELAAGIFRSLQYIQFDTPKSEPEAEQN